MNNIKLLKYDRTDISEQIDVNKISKSKELNICHYWYFLNTWLKFQSNICAKCHDLLMMSMNFSDVAIVNTVEKLLYSQGTFSLSRDFSTVRKLFHSQKNFSTVKELFHKQESLPQTGKFFTWIFPWSKKFSTNKDFYTVKKISASIEKEVVTFLTLKIQKGFKLQKLSTHKKHFLTHFNTSYHLETSKIKLSKGVEKDHWN